MLECDDRERMDVCGIVWKHRARTPLLENEPLLAKRGKCKHSEAMDMPEQSQEEEVEESMGKWKMSC